MTDGVITSTIGQARWLAIDNFPDNTLYPALMETLRSQVLAADEDPAVRAIVLTGHGDVFCGGVDTKRLAAGGRPEEFAGALVDLLQVIPTLGTPLMAAVNGNAFASGFSLACAADIAVAVDSALLGTVEAALGAWPMVAQVPVLQRLLPRHAIQNVISGRPFSASEAVTVGALNEIVRSQDELEGAIDKWVGLVTKSGDRTAQGRRAMYRLLQLDWSAALNEARREFIEMVSPSRADPV